MAEQERSVLVINDGGVPGLVASMMTADEPGARNRVHAWVPPDGSPLLPTNAPELAIRLNAVNEQTALLGYVSVISPEPMEDALSQPDAPDWPLGRNRAAAHGLLRAATKADELGCGRMVWPVVCAEDLDALFAATELAQLVGRIAGLDRSDLPIDVQTPFADLTHAKVWELAGELDVPLTVAWQTRQSGGSQEAA